MPPRKTRATPDKSVSTGLPKVSVDVQPEICVASGSNSVNGDDGPPQDVDQGTISSDATQINSASTPMKQTQPPDAQTLPPRKLLPKTSKPWPTAGAGGFQPVNRNDGPQRDACPIVLDTTRISSASPPMKKSLLADRTTGPRNERHPTMGTSKRQAMPVADTPNKRPNMMDPSAGDDDSRDYIAAAWSRLLNGLESHLQNELDANFANSLSQNRPMVSLLLSKIEADLRFKEFLLEQEHARVEQEKIDGGGVEAAQTKERRLAQEKDACEKRFLAVVKEAWSLKVSKLATEHTKDGLPAGQETQMAGSMERVQPRQTRKQILQALEQLVADAMWFTEQIKTLEKVDDDARKNWKMARDELDKLRAVHEARFADIDLRLKQVREQIEDVLIVKQMVLFGPPDADWNAHF